MRLINLILLIVLVALVIFSAINWQAITEPVPLSLLFSDTEAPLGLILLTITGLLTLLFLGFVVYMQSSTLVTRRKLNKEVEEQRKLANKAELSRFTELRTFLEIELQQLKTQGADVHKKVEVRLSEVEIAVKGAVEESGASLSAYIGELGDRLNKK
ncbi:MAG TPA: LapA family protein [Methylophilaceae bacterium]|nr:LapA family protein [Methylophilaceae bacterium]